MNRARGVVMEWNVELLGIAFLAILFVLGTVSTQATMYPNMVCTGTTCLATGTCPNASGCSSQGASCGSYQVGSKLRTCNSGNQSQFCNGAGSYTCTNLCQCYCMNQSGSFTCAPKTNAQGQPISCSNAGNNGYCDNPPPR